MLHHWIHCPKLLKNQLLSNPQNNLDGILRTDAHVLNSVPRFGHSTEHMHDVWALHSRESVCLFSKAPYLDFDLLWSLISTLGIQM